MSLLQKASIITTPTAYAEDYLYSIKPAYALGSELVTNGDFSNGTTSFSAYQGSLNVTDGSLVITATANSDTRVRTNITTIAGRSYKVTAQLKSLSGTKVGVANANNSFTYTGSVQELTSVGAFDYVFTAPSGQTNTSIVFKMFNATIGESFILDNVSAKEITDADFDFDRNSTGTRVNEDYLIEDVPYNLASYSENIGQWVNVRTTDSLSTISSPQNTTNVYKIIPTTDNNNHRIDQVITLDDNNTYTLSFFAKKGEYNCIQAAIGKTEVTGNFVSFNLNTGVKTETGTVASSTMNLLPNGWYRCSLTTTAGATDRVVIAIGNNDTYSFVGDASSGLYLWGVQLVKGDQPKDYLKTTDRLDIPRIDYTNGEPSILLEPSRTNLVLKSNDISNGGGNSLSNLQINSSNNLSPEGINNAQEIEVTSASQPKVESVAVSNATLYAISAYVKKVTGDFFGLGFYQGDIGNQYAKFNLDTGTFVAVQSNGATSQSATNIYNCEIIAYKNNWYRITCNILTGSDASKSNFKWMAMSESAFNSGVVGDKFLIYGRQAEQASYATSLIHTSGSTVTRSQDSANNAGNSDLFNPSAGCLYIETAALTNDYQMFYSINDGTNDNRIIIRYNSSGESINVFSINSSSSTGFSHTLIDLKEFNKIALNYNSSNLKLYVNGSLANSAVSPQLPSALTRFNFSNQVTDQEVFAKTKMVAVFKEALTDLELEKLTGYNNHELYMNYYNRLSYLGLAEEYNVESDINNYIL